MTYNRFQAQVATFHKRMGIPAPDEPVRLSRDRARFRLSLVEEELDELAQAFGTDDYFEQIDAITDLLYVVIGTAVEMGIDIQWFFNETHIANLRKENGPIDKNGKQGKPEGWLPPDHRAVFADIYDLPPPKP